MSQNKLQIGEYEFSSRLFMGTGKFGSNEQMEKAILASSSELVTVSLKRAEPNHPERNLLSYLQHKHIQILPNTSGARIAKEAVFASELARESLQTNLIKLEIHPDPKYLLPDSIETLKATEILAKKGFVVLPYCSADPVLCKQLEDAGAAAVMPLGALIGSNQGLQTKHLLQVIVQQSTVPVVVDAGIGAPSQATAALEMGIDAVMVNTAIAVADDPIQMAYSFKLAVQAGAMAHSAKLGIVSSVANASSPLTAFLNN